MRFTMCSIFQRQSKRHPIGRKDLRAGVLWITLPPMAHSWTLAGSPWSLLSLVCLGAVACGGSSVDGSTGPGGNTDGGSTVDGATSGGGMDAGDLQGQMDGGNGSSKDGGGSTSNDYGTDGPFTPTSKTEKASNGKTTFDVVVHLPSGKGPFPVVILSSGLQQGAAGYAPYGKRLASWGIAAILRDDPGFSTQSTTLQADVEGEVTSWLATADGNIYDATRVGLAGHSRGGQVSLLAAENGLLGKTKGLFLLDPVDNASASVKPKIAMLGVPLAMLGETTDSSGGLGGMDCAPAADNYASMYALAAAPALSITAVGADHVMFEDPASCTLCGFCTKGTADPAKVLALSERLMTTFFARVLLGDKSVDATLNTAADVKANTITVESK
jgi:dienelactone hydrolase